MMSSSLWNGHGQNTAHRVRHPESAFPVQPVPVLRRLADRLHLPRLDRSDTRIPTLGGQADVRTFLNVSMTPRLAVTGKDLDQVPVDEHAQDEVFILLEGKRCPGH